METSQIHELQISSKSELLAANFFVFLNDENFP